MAGHRTHRDELDALAAEVAAVRARAEEAYEAATGARPRADDGPAGPAAEMRAAIEDLRRYIEEGAEDARETARDHPALALSAAFLLGVAVGRLWRAP